MCPFWECFSKGKAFYRKCFEFVCKEYGLSYTELDILMFLEENPECDTAGAITENRGIAKPNVSTALRKLMERGFVCGTPSKQDRRVIQLQLCDKSQPVLTHANTAKTHFFQALLKNFSTEELQNMEQCFSRLMQNITDAESTSN